MIQNDYDNVVLNSVHSIVFLEVASQRPNPITAMRALDTNDTGDSYHINSLHSIVASIPRSCLTKTNPITAMRALKNGCVCMILLLLQLWPTRIGEFGLPLEA